MSPRGAAGRSLGAPFRSSKLCTAAGFGSCSLSFVSTEQFGIDRTFPSPNLLNCRLLIVGRIKSCSLAAIPAVRLLANPLVHHEDVGWPYLSGRGQCPVPGAALPPPSTGGLDGQEHCIIHSALASVHGLLHAGQELHCQHVPMGKALISCFSLIFPFS